MFSLLKYSRYKKKWRKRARLEYYFAFFSKPISNRLFSRITVTDRSCGRTTGWKLESFPWDHQKQIGKFQSPQFQTEYGSFHYVLKLGKGMLMSSFEKISFLK